MLKYSLIALICCFLAVLVESEPEGRIVGGRDALDGQFPHQVSLRMNGRHICGGSIIANYYILTAAHCVGGEDMYGIYRPYNPQAFTVLAGSINRLQGGVAVGVDRITVHERYGNFLNDIALLRLARPLTFTRSVQPIALASAETRVGTSVVISGWGGLWTGGSAPTNLQWNVLSAISTQDCYQRIRYYSESLICLAHAPNNGACQGDSGGPAVANGQLVGVCGFVVAGCGSANPDGYAKVFYHRNWIYSKMY